MSSVCNNHLANIITALACYASARGYVGKSIMISGIPDTFQNNKPMEI